MEVIRHGTVQDGTIVLAEPVPLPDGTDVVVHIEVEEQPASPPDVFLTLPFFGMHKDRQDMEDSVAWVQKERERWNDRLTREE
jgi:hypothetical protein